MYRVRGCNAEKILSFCHLTKQRLINELADGVNERHGWHDDASPDYRPKFRVFTEKAHGSCSLVEVSNSHKYTLCIREVYRELFAESLTKRTGLLQVIGIHELVVFLKGCLRRIIQHVRCSSWLASRSKELTDPQGTEKMRVAPFPGPFQDQHHEIAIEGIGGKRIPMFGEEDIRTGRGIGKAGSKDAEVFLKVLNHIGEIGGQIETKGIDLAAPFTDFEFLASEGQPPMPLGVLIQIAMQLHFADVALPQGNTKQEPEHECSTMLTCTMSPWVFMVRTHRKSLMSILQFTQGHTFQVITADPMIVLVMHRLRGRKRPSIVLQCLDLRVMEVPQKR